VNQLKTYLKEKGVVIKDKTEVIDFVMESGKIKSVKTENEEFNFDEVVLATGSWSALIATKLNLSLPMQVGKGYSFTIENVQKNTRIPSIFLEARVAVTPMGNTLRFGGTMEITGIDHSISMNRVQGIVDSIPKYYPEMKVEIPKREEIWHGLRPCSPDGLPYIGRSKKINNLIIATGHSMMGLSLGPGTGMLVKELVAREKTTMSIDRFDPHRFD
jgi:D-amino-acid dehydrogenase